MSYLMNVSSSRNAEYYFNYLDKALGTCSNCEKVLLVADFNTYNRAFNKTFLYEQKLSNLVKKKTCFKTLKKIKLHRPFTN